MKHCFSERLLDTVRGGVFVCGVLLAGCRFEAVGIDREPARTVEGWVVENPPAPGILFPEGHVWLVEDDGTRHCLAPKPDPSLKQYADRRVLAAIQSGDKVMGCEEPRAKVVRLSLGEMRQGAAASSTPPVARSLGELQARHHRWVEVVGAFTWLEPHFVGYYWKGKFRLADGAELTVTSVPQPFVKAFRAPETTVTALARVSQHNELHIVAVCVGLVENCALAKP